MSFSFPKLTAEEAASHIQHGQTVGFSGFTPAGAPKAIPLAVSKRAKVEHESGREFQIGVLTGASTGPSLDGALAEAAAISFRTPYQSNAALRSSITRAKRASSICTFPCCRKSCATASSAPWIGPWWKLAT